MSDAHMMDVALLHQRAQRLVRDSVGEPEPGGAAVKTVNGVKVVVTATTIRVVLKDKTVYSWWMQAGQDVMVNFDPQLINETLASLEKGMVLDDLASIANATSPSPDGLANV